MNNKFITTDTIEEILGKNNINLKKAKKNLQDIKIKPLKEISSEEADLLNDLKLLQDNLPINLHDFANQKNNQKF
ncbi:hypothetical protein [Megamonas funiformis]|uniref:hypothetical protein n=1 Tax=Megamonas funiformis TaxID=437897 RepID=UPI0035620307